MTGGDTDEREKKREGEGEWEGGKERPQLRSLVNLGIGGFIFSFGCVGDFAFLLVCNVIMDGKLWMGKEVGWGQVGSHDG